jgi:hypothetical protein
MRSIAECGEKYSQVIRASDSQCRSRNCSGFDPSILRPAESEGRAADEALLNKELKNKKNPPLRKLQSPPPPVA